MTAKILVADDEQNIVKLLRMYLRNEGYDVVAAADGRQALERFNQESPDLVLLDLMMPALNGFDVCTEIRKRSDVPVIMLTARSDDIDKIVGLEMGADDYVTKPFNPREVVARVKAALRRREWDRSDDGQRGAVSVGDVTLDPSSRDVTVGETRVRLRQREFDLLEAFLRHPNVVLDRERLLSMVWGQEYEGDTRTIDVHVAWLREKLRQSAVKIETVWGVGYKLVPSGDAG
ncbi:MAG: response regulator transcription factor [Dehalococcoidia bacterium]|mgnify:CR=1 FL=1|nr:response regulator transcription factor [Dehalococcoidia bacterium]